MKNDMQKNLPWLLLGLLGLFLIFGHNLALEIVCKVLAAGMILVGAAGVISWLKKKEKSKEAIIALACFVIMALGGLWILTHTGTFITVINVVIGVVMIIASVLSLRHALKEGKDKVTMILAVIGIIIGAVIALHNAATTWVTIAGGIGLIYTAFMGWVGDRNA